MVTLTAVPDAGENFLGWSGDAGGAANRLAVALNTSKGITANFTKCPRLVVFACGGPAEPGKLALQLSG